MSAGLKQTAVAARAASLIVLPIGMPEISSVQERIRRERRTRARGFITSAYFFDERAVHRRAGSHFSTGQLRNHFNFSTDLILLSIQLFLTLRTCGELD